MSCNTSKVNPNPKCNPEAFAKVEPDYSFIVQHYWRLNFIKPTITTLDGKTIENYWRIKEHEKNFQQGAFHSRAKHKRTAKSNSLWERIAKIFRKADT